MMDASKDFRVFNSAGVIDPIERFQQLQGNHEVWSIRSHGHRSRTVYSIGIETQDDLDRVLFVLSEINAGRGIPARD